jgi:putative MATE family efflux protein
MASAGTKDMTHGVPWHLISVFAVPIFLSQLFQQLYNTADALIVSKFLGDNALAAVSASGPLVFLMVSFFAGAATGAGVAISRYFGAGDYDRVSRTIHTTVLLGLFSSIFLTAVGVGFTPTLLRWMETDPQVMADAVSYFRCYFAGIGTVVMYNTFTGIMNALGDSRRPLYYLIVSSLTNIALDLLFVGAFRWGVWSAAVATIVSQAVSVVLCLLHLTKKGTVFQLRWSALRIDGALLREILRYGLPAGVQNSVIALANVVVQTNINSFGKDAMAAYGAYSKIEGFAFLPVTSFSMAITTYVSQNLGAGQKERARRGARFGILAAPIIAEVIGILTYLTAPALIGLFSKTPAVLVLGVLETRTISLFYFLLAFSHAVASVCRGAGKAFVPMAIMLSIWCVIRILYIMLMMRLFHQIVYVYWAYPLTWALSSVIYFLYFRFSHWQDGFDAKPEKA